MPHNVMSFMNLINSTTSPHRSTLADLLKGIAVVLMVQVHIMEQFATEELLHSPIGRVSLFLGGPPAAPVFLAVMGYFVVHSRKSLAQLMRRGVLLVAGGLLLNVGLNANLLYSISRGQFQLDPFAFIFGADILPVAGLSIICIALLRAFAPTGFVVPLVLAFAIAALNSVLSPVPATENHVVRYVAAFIWSEDWWSYFPLVPWLSYSLFGVAFAKATAVHSRFSAMDQKVRILLIFTIVSLLIATSSFAINTITNLPLYYHHGILLMLWISGFLFVWLMTVIWLNRLFDASAVGKYLQWLGRNVTSAYVIQWLIIGNMATILYRTQALGQAALWFVSVILSMSLLILGYQRVRAIAQGSSFANTSSSPP
ncbi:MAG: DUF1624 domain-containing protein [Ignavibacteriae bacterium]|nr:DUF1624 domain-containing protein [Ignavibacteriota bacterium]